MGRKRFLFHKGLLGLNAYIKIFIKFVGKKKQQDNVAYGNGYVNPVELESELKIMA